MISSVYLSTMLRHSLCTGALQTKTTVIVLQKCSTMKETPTDRIFYGTGGANYVPYSCLLISNKFCNGGSGPSRANKFLYAPAPPPPTVWALKPPSWALVFFGPQMALACRLDAISQGPKNSRIPGPNPLPLALVMDIHIQNIMHEAAIIGA